MVGLVLETYETDEEMSDCFLIAEWQRWLMLTQISFIAQLNVFDSNQDRHKLVSFLVFREAS